MLPETVTGADAYGIHPVLLDASLHALVATRDASDGRWLDVHDPASGRPFAQVPAGSADVVEEATEAAARAFPAWSALPNSERARWLEHLQGKRFWVELDRDDLTEVKLELARQTEFSEPAIRVNTDRLDGIGLGWDERAAWDELASYYSQELGLDLRESAYG